jgi:hypothetical protein
MEVDVGMIGFALVGIIAKLAKLTYWSFIHTSTSLTHSLTHSPTITNSNSKDTKSHYHAISNAICNLQSLYHASLSYMYT